VEVYGTPSGKISSPKSLRALPCGGRNRARRRRGSFVFEGLKIDRHFEDEVGDETDLEGPAVVQNDQWLSYCHVTQHSRISAVQSRITPTETIYIPGHVMEAEGPHLQRNSSIVK
jgi:hypothetical protein